MEGWGSWVCSWGGWSRWRGGESSALTAGAAAEGLGGTGWSQQPQFPPGRCWGRCHIPPARGIWFGEGRKVQLPAPSTSLSPVFVYGQHPESPHGWQGSTRCFSEERSPGQGGREGDPGGAGGGAGGSAVGLGGQAPWGAASWGEPRAAGVRWKCSLLPGCCECGVPSLGDAGTGGRSMALGCCPPPPQPTLPQAGRRGAEGGASFWASPPSHTHTPRQLRFSSQAKIICMLFRAGLPDCSLLAAGRKLCGDGDTDSRTDLMQTSS